MSNAERDLVYCHRCIRTGEFTPKLKNIAVTAGRKWLALAPTDRLLAACVSAEVFDYYGWYRRAARALEDYDVDEILMALRKKGSRTDLLTKRRLWIVLGIAQTLYREERYHEVCLIIDECGEIVTGLDPHETQYFGTRARLASLKGQTLRQLNKYPDALAQFSEATRFAYARFRLKTPFAEMTSHDDSHLDALTAEQRTVLDASQQLAQWTAAKNIALGTGWIKYTTGRLGDAGLCLSTGAILFRSTRDPVHRAYCQLLIAAVARARHADEPTHLNSVIVMIADAAKVLSQHPSFAIRAEYELALAYIQLSNIAKSDESLAVRATASLRRLDALLGKAAGFVKGSVRLSRWSCNALILKSRLARAQGRVAEAEQFALDALKRARKGDQRSCRIEALIAAAEVSSLIEGTDRLALAIRCLEEARRLDESNPKTAAVCSLHLAAIYCRIGDQSRAREEFARWHFEYEPLVEHGFAKRLAADLRPQLWPSNNVVTLVGTNYVENHLRLKEALIAAVTKPGLSKPRQAALLGQSVRTLRRWERELQRHAISLTPKDA